MQQSPRKQGSNNTHTRRREAGRISFSSISQKKLWIWLAARNLQGPEQCTCRETPKLPEVVSSSFFPFFPFRPWPVTRRVPSASMGLIVIAVSPLGVVDLAQWAFIRRSVSACSHAGRPGRPLRGLKEAQKTAARAYFTPSCQSWRLVKMW